MKIMKNLTISQTVKLNVYEWNVHNWINFTEINIERLIANILNVENRRI